MRGVYPRARCPRTAASYSCQPTLIAVRPAAHVLNVGDAKVVRWSTRIPAGFLRSSGSAARKVSSDPRRGPFDNTFCERSGSAGRGSTPRTNVDVPACRVVPRHDAATGERMLGVAVEQIVAGPASSGGQPLHLERSARAPPWSQPPRRPPAHQGAGSHSVAVLAEYPISRSQILGRATRPASAKGRAARPQGRLERALVSMR